MHRLIIISGWLAVMLTSSLTAQVFPAPVTGGVIDIEVTAEGETRFAQFDYQPAKAYIILGERLQRDLSPLVVKKLIPGTAGNVTTTFTFDPGYGTRHPTVVKPIRGVGNYTYLESTDRYRNITLTTTWAPTGTATFSLSGLSYPDSATALIEGEGVGRIFSSYAGPANSPASTAFYSAGLTRYTGKVSSFSFGLPLPFRYLPGLNNYWVQLQSDQTAVVFHSGAYQETSPGVGEFNPIGSLLTTGTPGHGPEYQNTQAPLTTGQAEAALRGSPWIFSGESLPLITPIAHYAFSATAASASKLRYKLQIQPGITRVITWAETFTPEGASQPSDYRFKTEAVGAAQTETSTYLLDPFERFGSQPGKYQIQGFESESLAAALTVDANHDGILLPATGPITPYLIAHADTTNAASPYAWLVNTQDANHDALADGSDAVVNGVGDLANFFPLFLNIQQLLNTLPPSAETHYLLKQADGALNFVYTNLTQATAFAYLAGSLDTGFGPNFDQPAASAPTQQITAAGVELSLEFLQRLKDQGQGVILIEGRAFTTKPLVLTVETGTGVVLVNLPLQTIQAELAVDANRDGLIKLQTENTSDHTSTTEPFRFWINDDDDSGDMGGADISLGTNPRANAYDDVVNGNRDLIDFFAVFLDLKPLLAMLPTTAGYRYKLQQADGAVNFVYTGLSRATTLASDDALAYHQKILLTGFGPDFTQAAGAATTQQVTAAGVLLSEAFLARIKDSDQGVILIEGRAPTSAPLVLSVENSNGVPINRVILPLRLGAVEQMYRHIDFTTGPKEYDNTPLVLPETVRPTMTNDPGESWPDRLTNGKYFVFMHGFNLDGKLARGWNNEIFKRLHVMGSQARFVGTTWHGATGPKLFGEYTDYHQAVYNAFQTGDMMAAALSFTQGSDVTVAAHSLGNIVVSHAIQSGGFAPSRYYMINAAVPIEAYKLADVDTAQQAAMVENDWKTRDPRFYAANWHQLFSSAPLDRRNELTWANRFIRIVTGIDTYNFYSTGEDIVENPTSASSNVVLDMISNWNSSRGAWGHQEFVKGTNFLSSGGASLAFKRKQAGWNRNYIAYPLLPDANNPNVFEQLKIKPVFEVFLEQDLFHADAAIASAKANEANVQYDLLARGLPALSYAAAANNLASLNKFPVSRNFDLEIQGRNASQWPVEGHTGDPKATGRWLHSDFKNAALPYVQRFYENMISIGSLK